MSVNPQKLVSSIYNPHSQTEEELLSAYVVRLKTFEKIKRDLEASTMKNPEQHYIIQGVRGMGKTTLLRRIEIEVKQNEKLKNWLIPIIFNEEEYGISSLADVWEKVAEYLELADEKFEGLASEFTSYFKNDDYERLAFECISKSLEKNGKKMLLLVDNIGDILKKFEEKDEQRFREVLITNSNIRLIGATSIYLEQLTDYKKPLFDFFKYLYLDGLTKNECLDLITKLGEIYHSDEIRKIIDEQPERIEILRRLTGGVTRTLVLLFDIFLEKNSSEAFKDLEIIVDRVTPLYKHRMDDLKPQQQKIVAALCNAWEGTTTKEIAEVVRMESKVVSAQLANLVKNRIVSKIETPTKNHLYAIEERFFNIWYLMRFGKRTDKRIYWYVKFLEDFIGDKKELIEEKVFKLIERMTVAKNIEPKYALYLTEAYSHLVGGDEQDNLKNVAREYLEPYGNRLVNQLSRSDNEIRKNIFQYGNVTTGELETRLSELREIKQKKFEEIIEIKALEFVLDKNKNKLKNYNWELDELINVSNYEDETILYRLGFYNSPSAILFVIHILFQLKKKLIVSLLFQELEGNNFLHDNSSSSGVQSLIYQLDSISLSLWNNNIKLAKKNFIPILKGFIGIPQLAEFNFVIKLFIAKKQFHFLNETYKEYESYRTPLYYANLHYIKDEYPIEYLRMPAEMKETVEELVKEIDQMAIDYA